MNQRNQNQRTARPRQSWRARTSEAPQPRRNQPTGISPTAGNAARYIIRELELEDSVENWRTLRDAITAAISEVAKDEEPPAPYYAQ